MIATTQKEALEFVFQTESGDQQSLKKAICEEMIEEFCLVGFLTQGVKHKDGRLVSTWHITKLGKEIYSSIYGAPTESEQKMGGFCTSIGL